MSQPECPWIVAQREMDAARERCQQKRMMRKTAPVRLYNEAVDHARVVLQDADPRPGKMTATQEAAQCAVVNAWLKMQKRT